VVVDGRDVLIFDGGGAVVRDNLFIMLLITIIGNDNGEMEDYWINNGQWPIKLSRFG
jgi:hypothetical protein